MAIPILIVDDSALARKMMIKALPKNWDVEITQAANGEEGLAAWRAGKGHVVFLDLTMPVMDGYETLKAIHSEGLDAFVIVVSGDIQPKAQELVLKLGAMAFLKKPIKSQEIEETLRKYGILTDE